MRHLFTFILALTLSLPFYAQGIVVTSFEEEQGSIDANIEGQIYYDQSNNQCALIKVYTTQTGFSFNFGNAVQTSHREQHTAQIWLWVSPGAKFVTISHQQLGNSDKYYFPSPVESARTYIMKLTTGTVQTVVSEDLGRNFLQLKVSPATAQVYVDDAPRTLKSDGSVTCLLAYGTHTYRVTAPNYATESGIVEIAAGEDKVVRTVSLRSVLATLTVKAASTADSIFINTDYSGMGSLTTKVGAGEYLIETRRRGCRSSRQTVTLAQEEQKTVTLQAPTPMYGQLVVDSDPSDATVYIDGKRIGTTPGVFRDILVGRSTMRLTREGYDDYTAQVNIQEGKTATVNAQMKKKAVQAATTPSRSTGGGEGRQTITVKGVSFRMVWVEGGTFTMGATSEQRRDANSNEKPAHQVTLGGYYIGEYEVTQGLWTAVMGSNPSWFKSGDSYPVESVRWEDCQEFIRKLNALTGRRFALPTEAQWEYAARGGQKSRGYKYSGGNDIGSVAWYDGNSGSRTHPVGQKQANELGLYDMSGNVWEWCSDWYGNYPSSTQTDPTGSLSGSYRVDRGGSWILSARICRVSLRGRSSPDGGFSNLGLRLVLLP